MLQVTDALLLAGISAVVVIMGLSLWKWSREHFRFVIAAVATFLGFAAWNILQNSFGAYQALNTDWWLTPISLSDVSTGIWSFSFTATALGLLTARGQPAWRLTMAAGIAGALAATVHIVLI